MGREQTRADEASYSHVGRNVREFRRAKGITQAELGERLKKPVVRQTISAYEKGENVDLETLDDIARVLGVPLTDLLERPRRSADALTLEEKLRDAPRTADFFRALADMVDQFDRKGERKGG